MLCFPRRAGGNINGCQGLCTALHVEEGTVAESTLKATTFLTYLSWEADGAWALNFYFSSHSCFSVSCLKEKQKERKAETNIPKIIC